jgi:hypothetical protein
MQTANITPPVAPLQDLVRAFERAGVMVALGGSGLLVALDLADTAHDWDLTTDASIETLAPLVGDYATERAGASGIHSDRKLVFRDLRIEVISEFAMRSGDSVVRLPTFVTGRWLEVPIGSPEVWAVAYSLLGRGAKANLLFGWLEASGADGRALERMLAEPLPGALRERLSALPRLS